MDVQRLIARWREHDDGAFTIALRMIARATEPVIRGIASEWGSRGQADDLVQEFWLDQVKRGFRDLDAFHGHTVRSFRVYYRKAARRFTTHALERKSRARQREAEALRHLNPSDRTHATESELAAFLADVAGRLNEIERRLLAISTRPAGPRQTEEPETPPSTFYWRLRRLVVAVRQHLSR